MAQCGCIGDTGGNANFTGVPAAGPSPLHSPRQDRVDTKLRARHQWDLGIAAAGIPGMAIGDEGVEKLWGPLCNPFLNHTLSFLCWVPLPLQGLSPHSGDQAGAEVSMVGCATGRAWQPCLHTLGHTAASLCQSSGCGGWKSNSPAASSECVAGRELCAPSEGFKRGIQVRAISLLGAAQSHGERAVGSGKDPECFQEAETKAVMMVSNSRPWWSRAHSQ